MKERTANRVICAENGAIHVLTKKRIVRIVNEYSYIGLECDDTGEWKPVITATTSKELDAWCAEENPKHDNVFRLPRPIELERLRSYSDYVPMFFRDPGGLTLENLKQATDGKDDETEEMILLLSEIYESAHQSIGIAIERMAQIKAEFEAQK